MGICYLVGAGDFGSGGILPEKGDLVIACDGGFAACRERGVKPDFVIGDFDSLGYIPEGGNCARLPVEKDITDMAAAVEEGVRRGYRRFELFGGTGGRLSHTVANIQMMAQMAERGLEAVLHGEKSVIRVICGSLPGVSYPEGLTGSISVFSVGGSARGVTLRGLKYPLDEAELTPTFPLGVSNSFTGEPAEVSVREGTLLIIEEY